MNSETIQIPVWLVSVVSSLIGSGVLIWGGLLVVKNRVGRVEKDIDEVKKDVQFLRDDKVGSKEFNRVYTELQEIRKMLQDHINKE